jgi:hypothetical protein
VLGRESLLGYQPGDGSSLFGLLDLFRYSAVGDLNPTSASGSFSVNGKALLLPFDNPLNGGDSGDWSQTVNGDSFDAFASVGQSEAVSSTDLSVMDVLGYHPATPALTFAPPNGSPTANYFQTQSLTVAEGTTLYFDNSADQEITFNGPNPVDSVPALTNDGTIATTSTGPITLLFFPYAGSFDNTTTISNGPQGVLEAQTNGGNAQVLFSSSWAGSFNNQVSSRRFRKARRLSGSNSSMLGRSSSISSMRMARWWRRRARRERSP